MKRTIVTALSCLFFYFSSTSQVFKQDHDTAYYKSYKGTVMARIYLSRKYSIFKLMPPGNLPDLSYHLNMPPSLGFGITYRSISFSISQGLNFLKSDDTKGRTNLTDLQLRIYKRKWVIDAVASFIRGYYLTPKGLGPTDGQSYYLRPDLGTQMAGLGVYRILNDKKFTYGSSLSQNAWQKKSAGSFLIGGEAFYITSNADSSFVPNGIDTLNGQRNINKFHLFEIGPSVGYAYMLVIHRDFFLMGSLNATLDLSYSRETGESRGTKIGAWPGYIFRLGTGYNNNKWNLGISWLGSRITSRGETSMYKYIYNTGNYRLVYARRFALNREMRKILN